MSSIGLRRSLAAALSACLLLAPAVPLARAGDAAILPSQTGPLRIETLASGLDHPWAVAPLPDGDLLLTERAGHLRLFSGGKLSKPLPGLPRLKVLGQGGLLDVAPSRTFDTDRLIFLTGTAQYDAGIGPVVIRAKLSADRKYVEHARIIYRLGHPDVIDHNFGARILVAPDNSLFVTIGDRDKPDRAQDRFDAAGSVIHIDHAGKPVSANPFADGTSGLPELWTKGHRNPQGITLDRDGSILTIEHGAKGGDELNRLVAGHNYGWPVISYGRNYDDTKIGEGVAKPGMDQPLHVWDPSIAPSSVIVYDGAMFPEWRGDILVTALKFELIARLHRDDAGLITAEEHMLDDQFGRLRDLAIDKDGALLVVTDEDDGQLLRISRPPVP